MSYISKGTFFGMQEFQGLQKYELSLSAFWLIYWVTSQYLDVACCYRWSSVVCHDREPCKNGRTDRDAV